MTLSIPKVSMLLLAIPLVFLCVRGASSTYKQYVLGMTPKWQERQERQERDATATAGLSLAVPAQPSSTGNSKNEQFELAKRLVSKISADQSKVLEVFTGVQGATGVIIQGSAGGKFVGWIAPGTTALFVGPSFDANGRNLTQEEMVNRGMAQPMAAAPNLSANTPPGTPQPSNDPAAITRNLFASLEKAYSVLEGAQGPLIYAFIDLNCPSCSEFWKNSRQAVAGGKARIRWIPVSILANTSEGKAAALLSSPNPVMTLAEHESRVNGGLQPITPTDGQHRAIESNTALLNMVTSGSMATPILINRGGAGESVMTRGLPTNMAQYWSQLK
jgi:hypothetical protein